MLGASLMTLELPSMSFSNFIWFLVVLNILLFLYIQATSKGINSNAPLVQGSSGLLGHWCGGLSYVFGAAKVIDLGYDQKHDIYQVKTPGDYCVMIANPKYIREMTDTPDEVLSMSEKLRDEMQTDHTMPGLFDDGKVKEREQYHLRFLKTFVTNRLAELFPIFTEEVIYQFGKLIKATEDEEVSVSAYEISRKVLACGNNRWIVGPKLCRDDGYIDIMVNFAINAILSGYIIRYLPDFLKGFIVRYIRSDQKRRQTAEARVIALINERKRLAAEGSLGKMDDALQALMDNPPDYQEWTPLDISQSILSINIGAVNLTVQAFAHCLFDIAEQTKFLPAIREEISNSLKQEGAWSKAAVDRMTILESFIKESQRVHPHRIATCGRIAQQDFTFSNGVTIPKGTELAVPILALSMDNSYFPSAEEFDGLRFYNEGEIIPAHRLSSSTCNPPLLGFGYGKHVCPGKAWAAIELKVLCAYLIHHYDMRLPNPSKRPECLNFFVLTSASLQEKIIFKKRAVECYDIQM